MGTETLILNVVRNLKKYMSKKFLSNIFEKFIVHTFQKYIYRWKLICCTNYLGFWSVDWNFKISKLILDIFSESLSSHIKSENYNADYNSKNLITFCKCKAYKIYKNYFCKIYLLHFVKIHLLLESNILFKPWSILKFLFRISRN